MKNGIIIAAAFTACLALCAAVWPQTEKVEKIPTPNGRDHPTADTFRDRRTGVASNRRKARIGNAGS